MPRAIPAFDAITGCKLGNYTYLTSAIWYLALVFQNLSLALAANVKPRRHVVYIRDPQAMLPAVFIVPLHFVFHFTSCNHGIRKKCS